MKPTDQYRQKTIISFTNRADELRKALGHHNGSDVLELARLARDLARFHFKNNGFKRGNIHNEFAALAESIGFDNEAQKLVRKHVMEVLKD